MVSCDTAFSSFHCYPSLKLVICKVLAFLLVVAVAGVNGSSLITEIRKGTMDEFMKGKFFVITYVDSTGCSRCRNLYPFFAAASQPFQKDSEIHFTRTYDKQLLQDWEITELPALVYHRKGVDSSDAFGSRGILSVDMTVDDITRGIEDALHGDFDNVNRKYSVSLEGSTYDEMVTTPTQSVLLMMHDADTAEEALPVLEKVAYAFRKDDAIVFASLDIDKHQELRDERFKTRDSPAVMWIGEGDKTSAKRFGGMLTVELLVNFINERTGLHRSSGGALHKESGRVAVLDELLDEHADIVSKAESENVALLISAVQAKKSELPDHQAQMLEYYVTVLQEVAKADSPSSAIEELVMNLEADLYGDEDLTTKTKELLKRRNNVLSYFKAVVKQYNSGQWHPSTSSDTRVDSSVVLERAHHVHTEL